MDEIWKPVVGYEGLYEVSNFGQVRTISGKLMKCYYNRKGYKRICLSKSGKRKNFLIHRLVMAAFKGASDMQIDHIDGDKDNNTLSNLEYVSNIENTFRHFVRRGSSGLNVSQSGKRYKSQLYYKGRNLPLGYFETKEEAVAAVTYGRIAIQALERRNENQKKKDTK